MPPLDWPRVGLGLALFLGLGALGAWAAGRLDPTGTLTLSGLLTSVPPSALALAVGLVVLDWLLGGARLHLWVRRLEPGAGYRAAFASYMVNMFAAALSPMGSASGPAQVAVLARYGVRPARAVAALLLNFVGVLGAFLVVGGLGGAYLAFTADLAGTTGTLVRSLVVVVAAATLLLGVIIGNPRLGASLARRIQEVGEDHHGRWGRLLRRVGGALGRGVADYRAALASLRDGGWQGPTAGGLALSVAMLLNKCTVGYVLARGMGYTGGWVEVVARQSLQWVLIYFSPSPGGSGIAEASVPAFLAGIVPPGRVLEFTVLWRVLTAFLGAAAGAVVAVRVLGRPPGPAWEAADAGDRAGADEDARAGDGSESDGPRAGPRR